MIKNLIGTGVMVLALVGVFLITTALNETGSDLVFWLPFALIFGILIIFGFWLYKNGYTTMTGTVSGTNMTPLSQNEKYLFIIGSLVISPVIMFTVLYFMWRSTSPVKVRETHKLFWIILPIWAVLQYAVRTYFPNII